MNTHLLDEGFGIVSSNTVCSCLIFLWGLLDAQLDWRWKHDALDTRRVRGVEGLIDWIPAYVISHPVR